MYISFRVLFLFIKNKFISILTFLSSKKKLSKFEEIVLAENSFNFYDIKCYYFHLTYKTQVIK